MKVVVVTPAPVLPVSILTALRHIRALADDVDLVNLYCRAAVQAVEEYTGRALITQTFRAEMERWPASMRGYYGVGVPFGYSMGGYGPGLITRNAAQTQLTTISLPRSPLVAIDSLKYYPDSGGSLATMDPSTYRVDVATLPGRLVFVDGTDMPPVAIRHDAIQIQFQAGYGTKESRMPPMLETATLLFARHLYDNPSIIDETGRARELPLSFQYLMRSQKI